MDLAPSPTYMSDELTARGLDTPTKQFRFVVNTLHAFGKTALVDVLSHVDRCAIPVLTHPSYFHWMEVGAPESNESGQQFTYQLFKKDTKYDQLPSWAKAEIKDYYLESTTSRSEFNQYFQQMKRAHNQGEKKFQGSPDTWPLHDFKEAIQKGLFEEDNGKA